MRNCKNQLINSLGVIVFFLLIAFGLLRFLSKKYVLFFNGKTTVGMIYDKGVGGTNRVCKSTYMFCVDNKLFSDYQLAGDESCNNFRIGQKGMVRYDKNNPRLNEIDFSINQESEFLDSIYNNHILFKSIEEIKNLFYDK